MTSFFKVDKIENIGENWTIATMGTDNHGQGWIVTTDHIRASDLHLVSEGAKEDGELIAELLNNHYTKKFAQEKTLHQILQQRRAQNVKNPELFDPPTSKAEDDPKR